MTRTIYFVPARDVDAEIVVKKSRFVCSIRRIGDEAAGSEALAEIRKSQWSARHHCSALRLGNEGQVSRANDDGEPAGTAGAPMLQALHGHDVSDVIAVVTRYFGGRKLGTGGLARAYGDAVAEGLGAAGTMPRKLLSRAHITVPLTVAGRVENIIRDHSMVRTTEYGQFADFIVATSDLGGLSAVLAAETSGLAGVAPLGSEWVDRA